MRCPKCDWTTVSFVLETREWRCGRCHAVVSGSGGSSWLSGKTGSAPANARARTAAPKTIKARAATPKAKAKAKKTASVASARKGPKKRR